METKTALCKTGITGSTLKWIAIITMLLDHIGAVILERQLLGWTTWDTVGADRAAMLAEQYERLYAVYHFLRNIPGRMAFPVFCFLLVEGFIHTRSPKKYAGRLFLFALISEIPFDLAFRGRILYWQGQNVFFTLLFGFLVIWGWKYIEEKRNLNQTVAFICRLVILGTGMSAAWFFKTDYNMFGVLSITVMYQLRWNKTLSAGAGCAVLSIMSSTELGAFLSVIPITLYNGKRGCNIKWFFYLFYPLHLILLFIIACMMGLVTAMVM